MGTALWYDYSAAEVWKGPREPSPVSNRPNTVLTTSPIYSPWNPQARPPGGNYMSDVIAQLPDKAFEDISDHLLCVICASPTDQWVRACHAQHSFCAPCLIAHENARNAADGEAKCPTCRGELVKNSSDNFHPDRTKNDMTLDTEAECPQKCGHSFKIGILKAHMQKDCPNGVVPCPMAKLGCEHVMKRCEVQQHLKDDNHMQYAMGFMMMMDEKHEKHINALETVIGAQNNKIGELNATVTNLNSALAAQTSAVDSCRNKTNDVKVETDKMSKKLDEALAEGEYSLKQIAIQTKKRASPGEGQSARAKRERSQVSRQNAELAELRPLKSTKDVDAAASSSATTDAAAAAAGNDDALDAAEQY